MQGLQRLEDVKPERHEWIWGDRIARQEIHFMAGKPDIGKGMMCAKIAADVSWGPGMPFRARREPGRWPTPSRRH